MKKLKDTKRVKMEKLYLLYEQSMFRVAFAILHSNEEAEDYTYLNNVGQLKKLNPDDMESVSNVVVSLDESKISIKGINDEFEDTVLDFGNYGAEKKMTYNFRSIDIYSNVNDIEDGTLVFDKNCNEFIDEFGNILPETIQYVNYGDGIDTNGEIISEESAAQKFVCVKFTAKNNTSEDFVNTPMVLNMTKLVKENGKYQLVNNVKDIECDAAEHSAILINCQPVYDNYNDSVNLKAGEEKEFMAVFCIDEQDLPYLYINVDVFGMGSNSSKCFYNKDNMENVPDVFNYVKVEK